MGPSWTLGLAAAMVCCVFTAVEGVAGEKGFEPLPLMTGEDAADAHLRLGVDFYLIDELDVAVREFREAVRQRPGFAEAYHNLGVGLARMGDLSGAITAWEQAERLAPDVVSTRYRTAALVAFNFGIARLHEKHLSEALDQWQEAIRWQPNLVEAHYALGYGYLTAGNPLPAVTHFRHALYWAPAWAKAYEGLGQAYYDSHDYGSAREAWLRAGELDPLEPRVSANLGLLSLQEGNFQLAIDYSRQALEREPTLASAHFNLGLALFRTGEDEASLKSFQNAWSLDPSLTSALLVMGIVKSRQGEWASAASLWRTALQKSPADSERMWLHFNYGVALHMMGETQGAIGEFHQVLQEQPDWAPGWMQLGQTFMGLHQWGQAAHAFEQAAALSPRSASLYYALGQARLQQYRFEEAGQAFRQAVKLEPTFWEGQYQLGVLLRARNRLGEAVEPLRRAAEGGFRQAQGLLASMYANGSGVDRNLPLAMLWWFRLGSAEDEVDRVSGGQELSRLRGDLHGQRLSVAERQAVLAGFDVIRQELMSSDARPVFSTVLMNGAPHWQSLQPSVPVLSWVIQLALALDGPAQDTLARWYEEGAFREVGQAHQRIEAYFLQAGKEGNPHSCQIIQRVAQKESAGERGADSSAGWGAAWRGCRMLRRLCSSPIKDRDVMRLIRVPPFLLACSLAIGGTLAGFGVMHVVPQVEQAILNWQAASFSSGPEGSRVVLVSAPIGHDRLCSPGRWHPAEFETMILAIRQAGASAIASLEDFSPDSGLRCGDLGSLAHLAETTTRVGHVLYPDTAPDMLQQAAVGIGSVLPAFDGGLLEEAPSLGSTGQEQLLPVGVAAAVYVLNYGQGSWSFTGGDYQVLLSDRVSVDVPMASFETIRDLFQSGERDRLAAMFQGKIAVVSAEEGAPSQTLRGAGLSSTVPVLHAKLTQAVLSHAWLLVVPLLWAIVLTMLAAVWLAYESLRSQRTSRFRWVVPGILLFGLAGLGWLPQAGWAWPMGGTILSLSLTTAASLLWRMLHNQAGLESRIQEVQRTLARLQDDLRGKQQCVRDLELKLAHARSDVQASDSVISELQESQETILRQLRDSESAVDSTRDRIHHLQHELASLRQHVPAALPSMAVTETSGCQALIQECEGFNILTKDPHLLDLFERLKRAAVTHSPILLLGETGTGKEVFARAAHALSPRRLGPFVSVNMAAIRPELFEGELFGHVKGAFTGAVGRVGLLQAANGGTLFLDEVGELPADVQAKLLRVLEDGVFYRVGESRETRVNVRIVAATNRNLEMEIEAGRYREDLYYRLRSIVLTLPPLRERIPEDRWILARAFLAMVGTQQGRDALGFSQGAMDAIVAYHWPGNVRELRQTIGQAVALTVGNLITEDDLRLPTPQLTMKIGRAHGQNDLDRHEDLMVLQCLRRHRFDMQGTARELGWDRSTVTQRLKGLGFQALVEHRHDVSAAARELAGEEALVRVVEARLREYAKNILPSSKTYDSAEQAIADCRKRFRNLPERHFPAVERFIHERFSAAPSQAS